MLVDIVNTPIKYWVGSTQMTFISEIFEFLTKMLWKFSFVTSKYSMRNCMFIWKSDFLKSCICRTILVVSIKFAAHPVRQYNVPHFTKIFHTAFFTDHARNHHWSTSAGCWCLKPAHETWAWHMFLCFYVQQIYITMRQLIKSFEYSLHHAQCHAQRWVAISLATHLWVWHGAWHSDISGNHFIHNYYVWDYPKYGTFCIPGKSKPEHETQMLKYGMSCEIWDGWQP